MQLRRCAKSAFQHSGSVDNEIVRYIMSAITRQDFFFKRLESVEQLD
jgi:hypothetical protein